MLKLSQLTNVVVYAPKGTRGKDASTFTTFGKVHMAVFSPKGDRVVGMLVKRPDLAGMVKREDSFVALDAIAPCDGGVRVVKGPESFDDAARARLGIDWDACLIWSGMDARTTNGKVLGYVNDASFNTKTGKDIVIEQRSEEEMTMVAGTRIAPIGSKALNPAFDVTTADLVTGFITEKGIFKPSEISGMKE